MSKLVIPQKNVEAWVAAMARKYGVTDKPNDIIALGDVITSLSGDDVKLDSVGIMLVHLKEKGVLTGANVIDIKFAHMQEKKKLSRSMEPGYGI
jgi:hypothetical protein